MTAETLKPFIKTTSVDYVPASESSASSVHHRNSRYFIVIAASTLIVILIASLLGIAIWNTVRVSNLQTEVNNLNKVIESMQKRLGLTYLDDLSDLEKEDENNNALIDDILPDEDDSDDSDSGSGDEDDDIYDEDEDEEDEDEGVDYAYDELMKKFHDYIDGDDDGNKSDDTFEDDNLYEDYEKYVDSTKKTQHGERKPRSLTDKNVDDESQLKQTSSHSTILRSYNPPKPIVTVENADRRRSPMRPYSSRRRKFPAFKSAKTVSQNNGLNEVETTKPAVHFHLTQKIPNNHSSVRVPSYNGDMYIGKPSWTNERDSLDNYFHVEKGVLTVHESGLYYVYAQVCYHNHYSTNGFIIFHGHKPFLQCLINIHTNNNTVVNTCHTSGLIYLKRDEHIHIRDFHTDRRTHLEDGNNRSYFGLIKI